MRNPDEYVGLPAGFLQAGVAGIVGSLWPVPDASTAVLIGRFYHLWRVERIEPVEALRQAQRWLRDSPNKALRDAFPDVAALAGGAVPVEDLVFWEEAMAHERLHHWAGFVYVGA
jgi:CHAT domain-containing protein